MKTCQADEEKFATGAYGTFLPDKVWRQSSYLLRTKYEKISLKDQAYSQIRWLITPYSYSASQQFNTTVDERPD